MLLEDLTPILSRRDAHLLLSYEIPDRAYDAKIYPLPTQKGFDALLLGHQTGLTIVWKTGSNHRTHGTTNIRGDHARSGSSQRDTTMLDLGESAQVLFEDDSSPKNSVSSNAIVDVCTVSCVSPVLHIAFPPVPVDADPHAMKTTPPILMQNMVLALACLDGSVRIITLPLEPRFISSSSSTTKSGNIDPTSELLLVSKRSAIQQICRGLTMTWTAYNHWSTRNNSDNNPDRDAGADENMEGVRHSPPSQWSFLVATHNSEATSSLFIYDIPLVDNGNLLDSGFSNLKPSQREQMPGLMCSLSFSPARFPSARHSQLLIADTKGSVRIYDCLPVEDRPAVPADQDGDIGAMPSRGRWLASFNTAFTNEDASGNPLLVPRRKHILDTKWVLNGKCIVALIEDGEWGVWDIEGVGPTPMNSLASNADRKDRKPTRGGISNFALHGYVGNGVQKTNSDSHGAVQNRFQAFGVQDRRGLAPMTPKTRRVRQENLFGGKAADASSKILNRGGVSVSSGTPTVVDGSLANDESLVIWYDGSVFYASSLLKYWQKAIQRSTSRQGLSQTEIAVSSSLSRLNLLPTHGEVINTISQPARRQQVANTTQEPGHDILLLAEHRFLLLSPIVKETRRPTSRTETAQKNVQSGGRSDGSRLLEQDLLNRGELSLGGLDKMLDGLEEQRHLQGNIPVSRSGPRLGHRKSVGFTGID